MQLWLRQFLDKILISHVSQAKEFRSESGVSKELVGYLSKEAWCRIWCLNGPRVFPLQQNQVKY